MKFTGLRLLILIAAGALAFVSPSFQTTSRVFAQERAPAQDPPAQDPIEYGVVYDCGKGKQFRVVECDGEDDGDWCKVQYLNKFSPGGIGSEVRTYRELVKDDITKHGCKPKQDAKKKAAARPQAKPDPEPEPEEEPAPKPKPKKPVSKPTPEPEADPVQKPEEPEQKNEDDAASAEPAPAAPGPQFSIGDCVQVDGGKGLIKRADGENFYVETEAGTKRVPFSSASKLKKATGCGG